LRAGFWLPKLAAEIAATDAFLLLIGPGDIGPWQDLEYQEPSTATFTRRSASQSCR
jgi:hypothetical protein